MQLSRRLILLTVVGVMAFAGAVIVIASDGMTAMQGTPISITGPDGVCKKVTNASATGLSEYIPTASATEWQSFVASPPAGVTLAPCSYTWSTYTAPLPLSQIAASADGLKLVAGCSLWCSGNQVYTSSNGGASWTARALAAPYPYSMSAVVSISSDGTKMGAGGLEYDTVSAIAPFFSSTNSGGTWTRRSSATYYWYDLDSSADATKLIAAIGILGSTVTGGVITSTDSGVTWTSRQSQSNVVFKVASSNDGTKLVSARSGGNIYTSTNSGSTWTLRTGAGARAWNSVTTSADGTKIAATTYNGYIYTSSDSGATWIARTSAGLRYWGDIAMSDDGTTMAAVDWGGQSGTGYLYLSTDSGVTWTAQTARGSRKWVTVALSADGSRLIAGAGTVVVVGVQ